MLSKIRETIARFGMLEDGDKVVCGLSGGADSVSLVYALHVLGYDVTAVHVDHMIRGEEARRDRLFAQSFCEKLSIPFECRQVDVPSKAAQLGIGLEECGRNVRYEIFEEIAGQLGCRTATAHTLSDSVETVIFNIARGSSIAGLGGIPAVRGNIIRPLINVTREEVEQFCRQNMLEYVNDSTNSDTVYTRNMIRHELVPRLRRINPSFHLAVGRLSECAASDEEYLRSQAQAALDDMEDDGRWPVERLRELPDPLLRRAAAIISGGCDYKHIALIKEMISEGSGAVGIDSQRTLAIHKGMISLRKEYECQDEWESELAFSEQILPDGRSLICEIVAIDEFKSSENYHNLLFTDIVDYDIILERCSDNKPAVVRNRRQGDRFAPNGRGLTKQVRKLFNEKAIPADRRSSYVMIECGGEIVWLEDFGAAEGCAVGKSTQKVLIIKLCRGENIDAG